MNLFNAFKSTALTYSNHLAIVCENRVYTYSDVLYQVDILCPLFSFLDRKVCIIYLPKSEFSVFLQLALNATNNIFIMIDTNTPFDRVSEIIQQTQPHWLVSKTGLSCSDYDLIYQTEIFTLQETSHSTTYSLPISHIYFSSGSTGKPKGILLSDSPVVEVVTEQASIVNMTVNKSFAWVLSVGFDASLSDIYMTLLSGGTLHICTFEQKKIKTLQHYLQYYEITHTDLSPSVLALLNLKNTNLESIIFGGELSNEAIIKQLSLSIQLFNAYGPTEASICTSLRKVDNSWCVSNIGNPLTNVNYLIVNNELWISGTHLCLGYLNQELNYKKFIEIDNVLYYKTGDLVSLVKDEHHYIGRKDRQIKHNGILICLEEIEAIAYHLGCVLAKCEYTHHLILYYQGKLTELEIREQFKYKLSPNMLPSVFKKVDSFSTSLNGKLTLEYPLC